MTEQSIIYERFTSIQNKGLLWKLFTDDGVFNTIPDSKSAQVQADFEQKIKTISSQIIATDNLVNLDKRVISEMVNDIGKYKATEYKATEYKATEYKATEYKATDEINLGYNTADLAQTRQKVFQYEFQNKKKEFDSYNSIVVPNKIDFADSLDSPIGNEMDKILAEQIAIREKQLNMVLKAQDKESAAKWIQNPDEKKAIIIPEETVKIKIGEPVNIDIKEPILKKKKAVVFADKMENDHFLSLLKKKTPDDDVITLLREILDKQKQILNILNKNKIELES
jgi:hypothetical protein